MERIVEFHGCRYLVPVWHEDEFRPEWRFECALPDDQFCVCHKTIKKRKPSKECFTETYTIEVRN